MKKQHLQLVILSFLFVCIAVTAFAGKTYSITYTFQDYETKKAIQGLSIQLWGDSEGLIETKTTDTNGSVNFINIPFKYGKLKIIQSEEYYTEPSLGFYNKSKMDLTRTIQLMISLPIREKILNEEMDKRNLAYNGAGPIVGSVKESELKCEDEYFVEAQFQGGNEALQQFIADKVLYPQEAIELGEQGRVFVGFIIETDGMITNIKVVKKVESAHLNYEAKRLMFSSPKWIPATCDGQKVRTMAFMPINFTLN